ncbi:transmembrane channel-like protein 7 [Heptranchias perlo]|uniref:transmembrane channel-like protein 7 n=1 Tax=Heptranchias perlo TaxID=212740 RepID=UPI00355ABC35
MNSLQTWLPNHRKLLRHLLTESRNVLSYVEIWKVSLHQIEGHFGTGIRSYFNFLRFLVIMNLCTFLLIAAFVVAPVITSERLREARQTANAVALSTNDTCTHYNPERKGLVSFYDYILDVLSATGLLELSYLFYGFYQTLDIQLQTSTYNLALA